MKAKCEYKYIYGPVFSWRLGVSLGIDIVYNGKKKTCSFDCVYCQAGKTHILSGKRRVFIPTGRVVEEIRHFSQCRGIDYITFSGAGEPTLAKNLGEAIKAVRRLRREKIAVITNSSLIDREDVQRDLALADFVIAKLDASSENVFLKINRPEKGIRLKRIIKGLKKFSSRYKGKFALQIMFVKRNKNYAKNTATLAKGIGPDEIHINTPLRRSGTEPLAPEEIKKIRRIFSSVFGRKVKIKTAYDKIKRKKIKPINEKGVLSRRGKKR